MKEYVFKGNELIKLEEMANIRPDKTGLKMVIWIFPYTGKEGHWARIKVSQHYGDKVTNDLFTVTIEDDPEVIGDTGEIKQQDIKKVIGFIKRNKDVLLQVWKDEIDPIDAVKKFKKQLIFISRYA